MIPSNHILIYSISYVLFFSMLLLGNYKQANRMLNEKGTLSNRPMLLLLHLAGIVLMGILPVYFFGQHFRQVVFGKNPPASLQLLVTAFLVIVAIVTAPVIAEKKIRMMKTNGSLIASFSNSFITNYFIIRILFLCAYEIWFRGYLLYDCINSWGISVAIPVNIGLYVLLHSVNGKNEMRGCVPLGLLLCGLCIWTSGAWPAIILHIAFAISYEAHLVKRINNPSISLV